MSAAEDLARCDREIAEIQNRPDFKTAPAWLLTMGLMDWEVERHLIETEGNAPLLAPIWQVFPACYGISTRTSPSNLSDEPNSNTEKK